MCKTSETRTVSLPLNKTIIFGFPESLLENDSFTIITLPHPADGRPTKYSLDEKHKKLYEVVSYSEPHRSWFIGESVKSDGSIQLLTPINPVFLGTNTILYPTVNIL